MVKCVRNFRFLAAIIITVILLSVRPTKCQISASNTLSDFTEGVLEVTEAIVNALKNVKTQEYNTDSPQTTGEIECPEEVETTEHAELEEYDDNCPSFDDSECYDEFYDEAEEEARKERTFGRLLLIGSVALLMLGICCIVCFTKKKEPDNTCPSVTTCFRSCKVDEDGNEDACVVNFMKPPPDISESGSEYQYVPLPLIYEDMGKICNNAEMFIQRCMTSSVKRTYSEPVKTLTSSKIKFRDYIKELAYLKEKQNRDCSKHGAVREMLKDMFKVFKKSEAVVKKRRQSADKTDLHSAETRFKFEDSTKDLSKKSAKKNLRKPNRLKDSSSSITITSLLLKPKYQCKYYKRENIHDPYKNRKRNDKEKETNWRFRGGDSRAKGERLPLICNQKMPTQDKEGRSQEISKNFRPQKMRTQDTKELIKQSINRIRQPFSQNILPLKDKRKMEPFIGLQDDAATMARNVTMEDKREGYVAGPSRAFREASFIERHYDVPSCSRQTSPLKPKQIREGVDTFDQLFKELYLMTVNNRNPTPGGHSVYVMPRESGAYDDSRACVPNNNQNCGVDLEEEARARMLRKYQELQMEVEGLNRSLREFADDFLLQDNRKPPFGTVRKKKPSVPRDSVRR